MKRERCVVLGGMGQVGSALVEVLSSKYEVSIEDIKILIIPTNKVDVLHIAIPWTPVCFETSVLCSVTRVKPGLVIIHSTVPVGTTDRLSEKLKIPVVFSPVRGQHDQLREALLKFVKYTAGKTGLGAANRHLETAGFKVKIAPDTKTLELAKLLCSLRYMCELDFYRAADKICRTFQASSFFALEEWTKTYNEGYAGTKFVRSELIVPKGPIGGNCITPNVKLLAEQLEERYA